MSEARCWSWAGPSGLFSALDPPYLRMKGKMIMERDFEPSFRLALAAKGRSCEKFAEAFEEDSREPVLVARRRDANMRLP